MKFKIIIIAFILTLVLTATTGAAKNEKGIIMTASDGNKNITLVWFVPVNVWPEGGWRLLDQKDNILVQKIIPLDPVAMSGLTPDENRLVQDFTGNIETAKKAGKSDQDIFNGLLILNVFGSINQARAFGLAWTLSDITPGDRTYKLQGLAIDGSPGAPVLISEPVNSVAATALPPAPENLKALPGLTGAELFWSPVKKDLEIPVLSYKIERVSDNTTSLINPLLFKGMSWNQDLPAYTDTLAPVEKELTYHVYGIDALGRESLPAKVTFFMSDMVALSPPTEIETIVSEDQVQIQWQHTKSPNTSGFIVERSSQRDGLYETVTPEGLKPETLTYKDKTVIQGLGYYYRVRSMGTQGDLGEPSEAVKVNIPGNSPPQPGNLKADINPILVSLSWEKPDFPVAGYFIERRAEGSDEWARLNSGLIFVRSFKDRFPFDTSGIYYYRVTATSHDNRKSNPSRELKVIKPDLTPPGKPKITSISGKDGKVTLSYEPGSPAEKTIAYKIIRDIPSRKEGEIIIENLPAQKTEFVDLDVVPGQGYWYAVVGVDRNKKESPWSDKRLVMVVTPQIPVAQKPDIEFLNAPFAHVRIEFKTPPQNFTVAIQRQTEPDAYWRTLVDGISGTGTAIDTNPHPSGISRYRIVYQSADGGFGEPSESVTMER